MKNISGIYAITNTLNGKAYIGSALNIRLRWNTHKYMLKNKKNSSKHLQCAWNKDGENVFKFSILEVVENKNDLIDREQYWIDYLNSVENGYNIRIVAKSQLGMKHSEETKKKMSKSRTGQKRTDETKEKMSAWQLGKVLSEETKKKIGDKNRGKKRSIEQRIKMKIDRAGRTHSTLTRERLSAAHKGKVFSEEHKSNLSKACKEKYKYLRENNPEKLKQSREHVEKRELARLATLRRKKEINLALQ